MGVPGSGMEAVEQPAAETLLSAFKTIDATERRKHASLLNYWLSIRGDKEFPPLHDLDPLELTDAGPNSALFELISGGHDAEIRHLGEALRSDDWPEQIMDAPSPSILSSIAKKLPIVAISRDFLAFEDSFSSPDGATRCWVTLLPLSAGGAWVDYVYALVSFETGESKGAKAAKAAPKKAEAEQPAAEAPVEDPPAESVEEEQIPETLEEPVEEEAFEEVAEEPVAIEANEPETAIEETAERDEPTPPFAAAVAKAAPGFTKLFDSLAGLTGFYAQGVKVEPVMPAAEAAADPPEAEAEDETVTEAVAEEPVAEEPAAEIPAEEAADEPPVVEPAAREPAVEVPAEQTTRTSEGTLQDKLTDVRSKADEARMAKLRANAALYEGLSAAYDFALDAEDAPEEYLRLVEAEGLKIQLRSPMKPVVKLAFAGMCDEPTIKQLEAVLAWAFEEELPRGSLAQRIEAAGGVAPILNGEAKAA
jgi:hypothetical protein